MVLIRSILTIAVAASATASVLPRTAATIEADLQKINTDTTNLHTAINNYNGGGAGNAIPIQNNESTLDNDIKSATKDAQASAAVSESDAKTILNYITGTLTPNINATLAALISKKNNFATDGLTSTVENDLKTLKSDTDSFGAALLAKAPSDQQTNGKNALANIDSLFTNAINQF